MWSTRKQNSVLGSAGIVLTCGLLGGITLGGCAAGYADAAKLERAEQGPSHCAERCEELGMRMGALVLVGDEVPGCVCQPVESRQAVELSGASASTAGFVALAAAASSQQQAEQQRRRAQQE